VIEKNRNLQKAKKSKQDEFYTQLPDIERELKHYEKHFKGKVVYCNCDDPRVSNFFRFFSLKFKEWGLKKLITTCYKNQDSDLFSRNDNESAVYLEYDGDTNGNNIPDQEEIAVKKLKGDGDFRSKESIELLKQADIVVTNPPFSLFREYLGQLIEHKKSFILIGNKNAITYKEIFRLIKDNKLWIGNTPMSKDILFDVPDDFAKRLVSEKKEGSAYKIIDGVVKGRAQAIWFTNMDIRKRHESMILYRDFSESDFPEYDNYNAIEVGQTKDIPCDYEGFMGVPISFLDKHNPEQFEIIGSDYEVKLGLLPELIKDGWRGKTDRAYLDGKRMYSRIIIKRR
jgi:hypothetical protein